MGKINWCNGPYETHPLSHMLLDYFSMQEDFSFIRTYSAKTDFTNQT